MAEGIIFEPSEYEILETFDFEEEVQRPEYSRFYTLEEQLTDFFERSLPERKPTKFEQKELRNLKDRIKLVYEKYISVTETDYIIDTNRKAVNVSWVHPVYAKFEYKPYSYDREWKPFFQEEQRRLPNYYPRLLKALPRPYISTEDGRLIYTKQTMFDTEGLNSIVVLPEYTITKTIINDIGQYQIVSEEIDNTGDDVKTVGFYLDERNLEIARPMTEHPFLKSNKASFFKTEHSLLDVYPSISAIMEHAVPVTTDPYVEGLKHLKLYDVRMSDIRWSDWKTRFPSVDLKHAPKHISEIEFKFEKLNIPAEVLTKEYSTYGPGIHPRFWLSMQTDSGLLLTKLLLTKSSESGLIAMKPPAVIAEASHAESLPEITCGLLAGTFDDFLSAGLFRPKSDRMITGQCIPVGAILQEKHNSIYKNKIHWDETTENSIKTSYQKLLKIFQFPKKVEAVQKYEKAEQLHESEKRRDIISILNDEMRLDSDKAEAIELIIRDLEVLDRVYLDTLKQFVICSHTIAELRGEMEDRFQFYSEWTFKKDGNNVCKYCGEAVNDDDLIAVTEYDEDGHITMEYSALETVIIQGELTLTSLKPIFNLDNAGEQVMFILLTFLEILPNPEQLLPILHLIRRLTAALKSKGEKIERQTRELEEGCFGIAGMVVLLQTHSPFLYPKRSVNNKPFNSTGYPRDSDDPDTCNALNSIINCLKGILASFPETFKGPISTVLRSILKSPSSVKQSSLRYLGIFVTQFKTIFENARERYTEPPEDIPRQQIILPIEKVDNPVFLPGEYIDEEAPFLCKMSSISFSLKKPPSLRQAEVGLTAKIEPSPTLQIISFFDDDLSFNIVSDKDIRKGVGLGIPTKFKELDKFIKTADGSGIVMLASQILTSVSKIKQFPELRDKLVRLDTFQSPSLIRDTAKSILFNILHEVKDIPQAMRTLERDFKNNLTFKLMLISKEDAEEEEAKLLTKERNLFKSKLRGMNDAERDVTRRLIASGAADFLLTNKDREQFVRELNIRQAVDIGDPEDGGVRDYIENGDQPVADDGKQMEVDFGDYGDRAVRDYDDYTAQADED